MKYFLILFSLISSAWARDVQFAIPFADYGCSKNSAEICLLKEYPIGLEISLFDKNSNVVCYGKVISHFTHSDEAVHFKASKIKNEDCKLPGKNYFLAIVNKRIKNYNVIAPKALSQTDSSKIGKEVFNSKRFEKYLIEAETSKRRTKGKKVSYSIKDFPSPTHHVRTYETNKLNITVVSHDLTEGISGALIAILKKEMFPISDVCVSSKVNSGKEMLMQIEEDYYFYTYSGACETGYNFQEVFKVKDEKIELVLRDSSWST